ncbi:MAG: helix-turn-helix transcriptional regulator [Anaerovibrio sp.]|uniref:helix-turn-helix domain-containing protein n=1 Tax=uncultured Anaerovibrio sp. TaxID=361586 RepID=UPI0025DBDBCE|nr:helix-turn-helix transcriptional regulator [uncultured Anaerovibrio sp.]MBQ3853885.1 helix-turn-helix transcriptional regulator [Anaerovibrio sp.]
MDTDFAHRLKELRISKDLTQKEFSELLKISQSAISMYESGQREPTMEVLDIFAKFFKVDVSYIMGKSKQNPAIDIVSPGPANPDPDEDMNKKLIAAYHKAPEHIQKIVTVCLEPYLEEKY